ncbi:helix-turn-helix domain-containing protein [Leisingera sp. D0M16]|uniref:helix-turn-helix domain-containing protein n=1 Tax=Leisingera coralii TaxID=3351347 RepID=UPI003B7E356F
MSKARKLLNHTDEPIASMAFAAGFSAQSHMTTTFRKRLGVSPAQLRGTWSLVAEGRQGAS